MAERIWIRGLSPFVILFTLLSGCTGRNEKQLGLQLKFDTRSLHSKTFDAGQTLCFGVNVGGVGIPINQANRCSLPLSSFTGFVASGKEISVTVPRGTGRDLQVFLYLPPLGVASCPSDITALSAGSVDFSNVYLVGQVGGLDTNADRTVVVEAAYPADGTNVMTSHKLATDCSGPAYPAISVGDVVTEEWGVASVPVSIAHPHGMDSSVDYQIVSDTATEGQQFVGAQGTLTIPAGETEAVISVPIISDRKDLGSTSFKVVLSQPRGLDLGTAQGTVTIEDDQIPSRSDWVKVTAQGDHTCAVTSGGAAKCWGYSNFGNIGDGTMTDRPAPTQVSGLDANVTYIQAGNYGSCALTSDGVAHCWGYNDYGALGDGTTTSAQSPVTVAGISNATQIERGYLQACALLSTGEVKCWGMNLYGQLGDGTNVDRSTPITPTGLSSGVAQLSVNFHSACVVTTAGAVKCWGGNQYGQVGNGTTSGVYGQTTPVNPTGLTSGYQQVSVGVDYACALSQAGTVKCWGTNGSGQLGDGTTNSALSPVSVGGLANAVQISSGGSHACALLADSSVVCWGSNSSGQIDATSNTSYTSPVAVPNLTGVTQIASGTQHTCARLASGQIKCWGSNSKGQLGLGEPTAIRTKPTVNVNLTSGVTSIAYAASYSFHGCAVKSGTVYCWGSNGSGELGDGTTTSRTTVSPTLPLPAPALSVSAGSSHHCALTSDGGVSCWGANYHGQLGVGTTDTVTGIVSVTGLKAKVKQVVSSSGFSCALLDTGEVQCWGSNYYGELGDGTMTAAHAPTDVLNITTATGLSAGSSHVCAVLASGDVQCWGSNYSGQLGDGTTDSKSSPVTVADLPAAAVSVTAGGSFTCAILVDDRVACWGGGSSGQLGDGQERGSSVTPVLVAGLNADKTVEEVAAGDQHACVRYDDGSVQCWGSNVSGQIGDTTYSSVNKIAPTDVSGLGSGVTKIFASSSNTCAVASGALLCWGDNSSDQADRFSTKAPLLVRGL